MNDHSFHLSSVHHPSSNKTLSNKQPTARQSNAQPRHHSFPRHEVRSHGSREGIQRKDTQSPFSSADNVINDTLINDGVLFNAFISESTDTEASNVKQWTPENFDMFVSQSDTAPEISTSLADALSADLLADSAEEVSIDIVLPKFGRLHVKSRKHASGRHLQLTPEHESTYSALQKHADECSERLSNDLEENVSLAIQKSEFNLS